MNQVAEREWLEGLRYEDKFPPCHSLDLHGRSLCGAELSGFRSPHPIGDCVVGGHERCATCDSLMMMPSEGIGPEMEAP